MTIAVDFDGTIVEHRYPKIGEEIPFATETLKILAQERHKLILWTVREGELLEEAIEWCRQRGVFFYSVNKDYPEEEKSHNGFSRKLKADLFIDDRNLGGLPDWGTIYQMIHEQKPYEPVLCDRQKPTGDLSWIEKLLDKRNK
ncbi:BT0820 family HAD-type phosphatase [Bacteroides fragilis]